MADLDEVLGSIDTSKVVKGVQGKIMLWYGPNKCGKSYNAAKAPKPLFLCFEQGLTAIDGIPYKKIRSWRDFRVMVKALCDPKNFDRIYKDYQTIVVDALDGVEKLSAQYVCSSLGINSIREYNQGYGAWKEWADEIDNQLRPLVAAGYTVIFLGHEGERAFKDENGEEYTMVYPRGDKRVIDPVLNYVDITCYIRLATTDAQGNQPLSTLYLKGNKGFFAGSRFMYLPKTISEWSWDKLDAAVETAIEKEANGTGITVEEAKAEEAKVEEGIKDKQIPLDTLKRRIVQMISQSMSKVAEKEHQMDEYKSILATEVGNKDFKCNTAGEGARDQVEIVYEALLARGYTFKD